MLTIAFIASTIMQSPCRFVEEIHCALQLPPAILSDILYGIEILSALTAWPYYRLLSRAVIHWHRTPTDDVDRIRRGVARSNMDSMWCVAEEEEEHVKDKLCIVPLPCHGRKRVQLTFGGCGGMYS